MSVFTSGAGNREASNDTVAQLQRNIKMYCYKYIGNAFVILQFFSFFNGIYAFVKNVCTYL